MCKIAHLVRYFETLWVLSLVRSNRRILFPTISLITLIKKSIDTNILTVSTTSWIWPNKTHSKTFSYVAYSKLWQWNTCHLNRYWQTTFQEFWQHVTTVSNKHANRFPNLILIALTTYIVQDKELFPKSSLWIFWNVAFLYDFFNSFALHIICLRLIVQLQWFIWFNPN